MAARKTFSLKNLPKGCTTETAEKIDRWVTKCWDVHWREYGPSSNYRTTFLDYALRDYKDLDDKEMTRIYNAVVAQTKHFRMKAKAGDSVKGKGLGVWYNQGVYDNEFIDESAASLAERSEVLSSEALMCIKSGCKDVALGSPNNHRLKLCEKHTETHAARLKMMNILKDIGVATPGQSLAELSQSCREYLQISGAFGKALKGTISSEKVPELGGR